MMHDKPKSQDDNACKILQFRRRDDPAHGLHQLLDLERYENPRENTDYRLQMVENVAAVVFLFAFVAIAAFSFIDLEQVQHCASAGGC